MSARAYRHRAQCSRFARQAGDWSPGRGVERCTGRSALPTARCTKRGVALAMLVPLAEQDWPPRSPPAGATPRHAAGLRLFESCPRRDRIPLRSATPCASSARSRSWRSTSSAGEERDRRTRRANTGQAGGQSADGALWPLCRAALRNRHAASGMSLPVVDVQMPHLIRCEAHELRSPPFRPATVWPSTSTSTSSTFLTRRWPRTPIAAPPHR
jgi:hypothetical protein